MYKTSLDFKIKHSCFTVRVTCWFLLLYLSTKCDNLNMALARRTCVNKPGYFCYICGEYILTANRKLVTNFIERAYHSYFGMQLGDQDKDWAPHSVQDLHGASAWLDQRNKDINIWNSYDLEGTVKPWKWLPVANAIFFKFVINWIVWSPLTSWAINTARFRTYSLVTQRQRGDRVFCQKLIFRRRDRQCKWRSDRRKLSLWYSQFLPVFSATNCYLLYSLSWFDEPSFWYKVCEPSYSKDK